MGGRTDLLAAMVFEEGVGRWVGGWMDGWIGGCVGRWVGGRTNLLATVVFEESEVFLLELFVVLLELGPGESGWVGGWMRERREVWVGRWMRERKKR